MKNIINILPKFAIALALLSSSCTKDFDEINTNPNYPETAPNLAVLSYSIVELGDRFDTGSELSYPASYIGHVAKGQNNEATKYMAPPPSGMWSAYYVRSLHNLNNIINSANEKEHNIKAAAMVLKAYATMINVDAYGASPYFEATKLNEGIINPKFDSEEDIYTDLLKLTKDANDLFEASGVSPSEQELFSRYDILHGTKSFSGEILSWKKFANSLRLRLAIRISMVDIETSKIHINEILNDPSTYPVIDENGFNATLVYPGGDGWIEPWTDNSGYLPYVFVGEPLVDSLKKLSDPRLPMYAKGRRVTGLPIGADGTSRYSPIADKFWKNTADGSVNFLTFSEVEFIKAEAISRGIYVATPTDAQDAYKKAIRANMESLDVEEADITTYIASAKVVWDGSPATINKVYIQKWLSLFHQSWEAWAEMRRTDVPLLPTALGSPYTGHNRVPFRFRYPDSETQKNSAEITANVVDSYWGDQIWWDTRTGVN